MINEDELIYLCGKHIVRYDIPTKNKILLLELLTMKKFLVLKEI